MSGKRFGVSPYTLLVEVKMNTASGAVQAGGFEHVERAAGVDVEVGERLAGGPVV